MYPETPIGQLLGAFIGFIGVCVFALPVAILGAGFIEEVDRHEDRDPGRDESEAIASSAQLDASSIDSLADRVADKVIERLQERPS